MIRQMVEDAQNNDTNRFTGAGGGGSVRPDYQGGPQGGHTVTIKIPVTKVGLVIGRGGETIRDFEERSKAKILIASDGSGDINNERIINLVGDETAVQHAKSLIEDIVFGSNNVRDHIILKICIDCLFYTTRLYHLVIGVIRLNHMEMEAEVMNNQDMLLIIHMALIVWVDLMMNVFSSMYQLLLLVLL